MSWALKISFDKSKVANMGTNSFFFYVRIVVRRETDSFIAIFSGMLSPHIVILGSHTFSKNSYSVWHEVR